MKLDLSLRVIAIFASALLLLACSAPFKTPVLKSRPSGQADFLGVAQLVAAAPNRTLDILMVHGMCTHGRDWAEASTKRLNSALGGTPNPEIVPLPVSDTQVTLYQSNLSVPQGTIRTNALVWSPILMPLKQQLCYDQTNKSEICSDVGLNNPPYPYQRATLNRILKDGLLNDCLADAIIYQGKSRDSINEQIQKAILTAASSLSSRPALADIFKGAATESAPMVLITESLGSKVAFDAIYKLVQSGDPEERAAGLQTFDRTILVFMGANQLPILALADQTLEGGRFRSNDADYPEDPLAELIARKKTRISLAAAPTPRVVAFSDPNDLLSYILTPARDVAAYDLVDVIVSNENTYFGFLEPPHTAHIGYLANPEVIELIACGTSKTGCRSDGRRSSANRKR